MSIVEIRDIVVSAAALTLIFSYPRFLSSPSVLLVSAAVILTGFLLHELAHRFVARRFGYRAEYRMWTEGIMLALMFALLTNGSFIFAAPGAVFISSHRFSYKSLGYVRASRTETGLISLAGPATNLLLAALFLALSPLSPVLYTAAYVNAWFAFFNLIPFPPLDGSKIIAWNAKAWAAVAVVAFAAYVML